ncbi:MAG: PilZ domain-containing protein [Planctomycetota bacterium]|jgi:hypothetical protein
MNLTPLKFVPAVQGEPQPAFELNERRCGQRFPATECVTVVRRSLNAFACLHPLCSMRLRDVSTTGASAFCEVPLRIDESVSIFFPPSRYASGYETHGIVRRCETADETNPDSQYVVAIEFVRAISA